MPANRAIVAASETADAEATMLVQHDTGTQGQLAHEANTDPVMLTGEAAAYVRMSKSTLAKWRMHDGAGPRFIRLGGKRVGYRRSALDKWLAGCERGSTIDDRRSADPIPQA